ncbi:hypothetical protein [Methanobrevibacter sp. DSM 116169]|uniref:hypothetical protein n=1 Tax=Methanobrevibacter sp. DSM 116169 TaxID=3242727 RepID=UPI0038FD3BBC
MGFFNKLFSSKSAVEKEMENADKQLRKTKKSIEKDKKLLDTLKHKKHPDGTLYTKQDCVAYAFLYTVKKQYDHDGVEFDMKTGEWLLDEYCGGSDTYNDLFLLNFMVACSNEKK